MSTTRHICTNVDQSKLVVRDDDDEVCDVTDAYQRNHSNKVNRTHEKV